jgi:hypothetical protein
LVALKNKEEKNRQVKFFSQIQNFIASLWGLILIISKKSINKKKINAVVVRYD